MDDFFQPKGRRNASSSGELGGNLRNINWDSLVLSPIVKDVYEEHPTARDRSPEEVEELRKASNISFIGKYKPPNPITSFEETNILEKAKRRLKNSFEKPTPIQANTWPAIMKGSDLVGSAETGSGKTLAFLIPAFEHIVQQSDIDTWPKVLVIAPTRELVRQIWETSLPFARDYKVGSQLAHGGSANRIKQERSIRTVRPELLVAAPGRVIDFVENGLVSLENVSMIILDEADLLFQMGFEEQIKMILSQVRPDRQAVMFSATWPTSIQHLAKKYFRNYLHMNVGSLELSANPNVSQEFHFLYNYRDKIEKLAEIIQQYPDEKMLVFVKTKANCETIKEDLLSANIRGVGTLHGDHSQHQRERELSNFHSGRTKILMSTDLASRGLDIKDVKHVVNYDMPENISPYIHRIGRTGRAGQTGMSHSFVSPTDAALVPDLVKVLKEAGQPVPERLENYAKGLSRTRQFRSQGYRDDRKRRMYPDRPFAAGRGREQRGGSFPLGNFSNQNQRDGKSLNRAVEGLFKTKNNN